MSYQKPICDCGKDLLFDVCRVVNRSYKVNRNGEPYKNPTRTYEGEVDTQVLYCFECSTTFSVDNDDKNRIVKGDKIS